MAVADVAPGEQPPAEPAEADPSIILDDVHVSYRVYEQRRAALREVFAKGFKPRAFRSIDAVQGVSFTAHVGEVVGLIGPNGSGKSTLLRCIAGLLPATSGSVYARSRPMLLGVGAALQPNLSGRRNIMIGCLALGMSRAEIDKRQSRIIAFAGLEEFIDLPMRTYSSGMRARLHFAIATAVTPEILLIDEALAVGDRQFKRRSNRRIRRIRDEAGTVIVVSHNLGEIRRTCSRTIWLERGKVVMDAPTAEVLEAYTADGDDDDPDEDDDGPGES